MTKIYVLVHGAKRVHSTLLNPPILGGAKKRRISKAANWGRGGGGPILLDEIVCIHYNSVIMCCIVILHYHKNFRTSKTNKTFASRAHAALSDDTTIF